MALPLKRPFYLQLLRFGVNAPIVHKLICLLNLTSALSVYRGAVMLPLQPPPSPLPTSLQSGSLCRPNNSLCHHDHSCHGNLAWVFGGMCGIAGDWLPGARCFPIRPVTGVRESPPHPSIRGGERALLWQCYPVMVMFKQLGVLYDSHFTWVLLMTHSRIGNL